MFNVKNILVPVDFSDQSRLSLDVAISLARKEKGTTLFLLHILPCIRYPEEPEINPGLIDEACQEQQKKAEQSMEEWQERVPPPLSSESILRRGKLDQEIAAICGEKNIDLIVMTTHGRHGLDRLVHPNVSEKVIRNVPCPVLVLHMNRRTAEMAEAIA